MVTTRAQQDDATLSWWLDLVLGVLLLAASLSWATHLTSEPSTVDLVLSMAFLLAGSVFACTGTVALRERVRH